MNVNRLLDLLQVHSSRRAEVTKLLGEVRAGKADKPRLARLVELLGVSYANRNEAVELFAEQLSAGDLYHEIADRRSHESAEAARLGMRASRSEEEWARADGEFWGRVSGTDPMVIRDPAERPVGPPPPPSKVDARLAAPETPVEVKTSVGGKGGERRLTDPHLRTVLKAARTIQSYMGVNATGGPEDDLDVAELVRSVTGAGQNEARLAEVVREAGSDVDSGSDFDGFLESLAEEDRDHVAKFVKQMLTSIERWWEARSVRGPAEFKAGVNVLGIEAGVSTGAVKEN